MTNPAIPAGYGLTARSVPRLQFTALVVLVMLLALPHFFLPAEDAVILHQYSRNLAEQGAITYYSGGPRAEGATDFAWMALVAGAIRCGIAPPVFTAVINFSTLLLLGLVMLRAAGLRVTATRLLMIAGAAGLVPQIVAAGAGFAVLPDALLLTLLAVSFTRQRVNAHRRACSFALPVSSGQHRFRSAAAGFSTASPRQPGCAGSAYPAGIRAARSRLFRMAHGLFPCAVSSTIHRQVRCASYPGSRWFHTRSGRA